MKKKTCPVSPIIANLCMEVVEELAINTSTVNQGFGNDMLTTASSSLRKTLSPPFMTP